MLAYLRGTIQSKQMTGGALDCIVLDVAGVGFELHVSHRTMLTVGDPGDEVTVHTALAIRENDWTIFGFSRPDERVMFEMVQSVTGIGPKLAMALIGTFPPEELADAIVSEDHKLISQAPGVGPKVAQRLILELKGRMDDWKLKRGLAASPAGALRTDMIDEIREILYGLGYTATEVNMALKKAEEDHVDADVEQLVRHSLKVLGAVAR